MRFSAHAPLCIETIQERNDMSDTVVKEIIERAINDEAFRNLSYSTTQAKPCKATT
jgi:transposase-like protein